MGCYKQCTFTNAAKAIGLSFSADVFSVRSLLLDYPSVVFFQPRCLCAPFSENLNHFHPVLGVLLQHKMFLYTILSKLTYNTDIQDQQCFSEEKYWFEASCQYLLQGKEERKNITIYCCSARQINSIFYQKKILLIKFENYQRVISAFCQCLIDSKLEFINPSRHFSSLLCHFVFVLL